MFVVKSTLQCSADRVPGGHKCVISKSYICITEHYVAQQCIALACNAVVLYQSAIHVFLSSILHNSTLHWLAMQYR